MNLERIEQLLDGISSELRRISLAQDNIVTKIQHLTPPKIEEVRKPIASTQELEICKFLDCPICGGNMHPRHRKSDGALFYGCGHFPTCKGILPGDTKPTKAQMDRDKKRMELLKQPIVRTPVTRSPTVEAEIVNDFNDDDSVPF